MWDLWQLCGEGESYVARWSARGVPTKTRIRWRVDWDAYRECRESGHPAFSEASGLSVMGAMRFLAQSLSQDVDHQNGRYGLLPVGPWLERERVRVGLVDG